MTPPVPVRPFGRRAFLVELADQAAVHRVWRRLTAERGQGSSLLAGVEEVVAGARTVLVVAEGGGSDIASLADRLSEWLGRSGGEGSSDTSGSAGGGSGRRDSVGRPLDVPVVYDGPDLDEVAELTGLSVDDVVSRHTGAEWTVGFLGFSPGFAYLGGGDPGLAVPRRRDPRPVVPAGTVALAGAMSAVYPAEMPGGWQLIGRADVPLFDPTRDPPALLAPGDRVRFRRVGRLSGRGPSAPPARRSGSADPTRHTTGRVMEVIHPGPLTTVQDRGRIGHAHEGVPRAGAADGPSLRVANALAGNPPGTAGLETTLRGPTLRFPAGGLVAVAGAEAPVTLDGVPVAGFPVLVPPGSVLAVGTARRGVRSYVAVAGGVDLAPVLGSRSSDTLSGLGPAPLRTGDVLPLGSTELPGGQPPPRSGGPHDAPTPLPDPRRVQVVRAAPGPRADWLAPGQLDALFRTELTVSPVSDRVGLRTEGLELKLRHPGELPSEGMVAGAVQVPPGGRPIVLLANHATTGGYPVVAVVEVEDLAVLAQARPGSRLRLERV